MYYLFIFEGKIEPCSNTRSTLFLKKKVDLQNVQELEVSVCDVSVQWKNIAILLMSTGAVNVNVNFSQFCFACLKLC